MSVIFGLLITVIGVIVQLSAKRFTSHVTSLFFRDPTIGLSLSYVVFCNAFGFWVYLSIGDFYVPRASVGKGRFKQQIITLYSVSLADGKLTFVAAFPFLGVPFLLSGPRKSSNKDYDERVESRFREYK
jgi:hypothetical protein